MKRKLFVSLLLAMMIFVTAAIVMVGCNNDKIEYSVTVVDKDNQPVAGITVNWTGSKKGSAVTGADGKATASLVSGTYTVTLSGYEDGLTYTSATVNASMPNVRLKLTIEQITYTATVIDKTGSPVNGATVTWMHSVSNAIAGTATTDATGKASVLLNHGEYIVSVANLPDGNLSSGNLTTNPQSTSVEFRLVDGVTQKYTVKYRTEGGLKMDKEDLIITFESGEVVQPGRTDDNGVFTISLAPNTYLVRPFSAPAGYSYTSLKLTEANPSGELIIKSSVIKGEVPADTKYVIGDIIHDYTFTTPYNTKASDDADGEYTGSPISVKISEALKSKKAIFINNWGTNCTWCVEEMPAMQQVYEKYGDKIEIIAVSNYPSQGIIGDSDEVITKVYREKGYTFPMMRDLNGMRTKFSVASFPTTVVIDRYGAIARIEIGAITTAEVWGRLIEKYIGDDYVQDFVRGTSESDSINNEIARPDVTIDADHYEKMAEALNKFTYNKDTAYVKFYGEENFEYAWPFLCEKVTDVSENGEPILFGSNGGGRNPVGKANSMSFLYADVKIPVGKVFTFKYYASCEDDDVLSILWDGKVVKEIYGEQGEKGWQTCYLYTDLTADEHTLAMTYIKDRSGSEGKDNVFIKDIDFVDFSASLENVETPIDMLRAAAYGKPSEGATKYPNYMPVTLKEDGYYHVNLANFEHSAYTGTDSSPLLFANLLSATNLNSRVTLQQMFIGVDADTNYYICDCTFEYGGVTKDWREDFANYIYLATISDIYGFIPVDAKFAGLLDAFLKHNFTTYHENEWLEPCYFYSHYGNDGKFVGNPLTGLTDETAVALDTKGLTDEAENKTIKIETDLRKNINPFPFYIYTFEAPVDAVYRFHSLIEKEHAAMYAAQIWIYDGVKTTSLDPLIHCGETHLTLTGEDEQNFDVYRYMKAGEKYYLCVAFQMNEREVLDFEIVNVGQSATALLPCSDNDYTYKLDANGNITNELMLAGAVDYEYDKNDGFYYAIYGESKVRSQIFVNVGYISTAGFETPIKNLINVDLKDPVTGKSLGYKVFDFRYRIAYRHKDGDENIIEYNGNLDLTQFDADKYKDYTAFITDVVAEMPGEGEKNAGLVPLTKELVEFLSLYIETRTNMSLDGKVDQVLDNEWLRFCWYYRTYDSTNV